jgi:hypothetical protein
MLDAQGLTNFGGVYVSPKTGQTVPDYVPVSDKGKLATAIQDLLGSLYTYPGATVGLPSKTSIDTNIALGITGATKKKDFNKVTPEIPEGDQDFATTVQNLSATTLHQNVQSNPPVPHLQPTARVEPQSSPLTTALLKPARTTTSSKKKKKAEYVPQLLPGQSSLGQLP